MSFRNFIIIILLPLFIISSFSCQEEKTPTNAGQNSDLTTGTVTDIEGNVYQTIKIGNQWWMAENLKVTRYNNGDLISNIADDTEWKTMTTPAYCWYQNNKDTYGAVYGALYNWYVVDTSSNGNRSICPTGWHIPTTTEWNTLTDNLGGLNVAGGKMKEAGTSHWESPNTGATNSSGFTALPGGYRGYITGAFDNIGLFGHWWSSTEDGAELAWGEGLFTMDVLANHSTSVKKNGFSIRCVKD